MKKNIMICSLAIFFTFISIVMIGCESADGYSIDVNVSSYHVEKGESVAISASGWSDFSWSISNPSIGSLDKYTGSRVVYTSRAASGTQVVTVVARGTSATATTNSTNNASAPSQYSRTIEIYHGAEEDISSEYSEDSSTSTIDPSIPEK